MFSKSLCVLVLWTKVASALEGHMLTVGHMLAALHNRTSFHHSSLCCSALCSIGRSKDPAGHSNPDADNSHNH